MFGLFKKKEPEETPVRGSLWPLELTIYKKCIKMNYDFTYTGDLDAFEQALEHEIYRGEHDPFTAMGMRLTVAQLRRKEKE